MWAGDLSGFGLPVSVSGTLAERLLWPWTTERSAHTQSGILNRSASLTCSGCILFCWIWLLTYTYNIYIYICILPFVCSRDMLQLFGKGNWFPLEICFKFTQCIYNCKGQGSFICHMINYTGYNQKWNVDQIRSAQWTVQRIKII